MSILASMLVLSAEAFAPIHTIGRRTPTQQFLLTPDQLPDPATTASHLNDLLTSIHTWDASQLLADAAVAVPDAAANAAATGAAVNGAVDVANVASNAAVDAAANMDASGVAQELGWWGKYLNIFKSTLELVHSTIDAPLKSVGVENTWGISIAVFTLSKSR